MTSAYGRRWRRVGSELWFELQYGLSPKTPLPYTWRSVQGRGSLRTLLPGKPAIGNS